MIQPKIHMSTSLNHINGRTTSRTQTVLNLKRNGLAHTIQSLLERLDAIRAQKSNQNGMPSTSSASQLYEIALPVSASEQKHESEKLNSASALPSTVPRNTIVVSNEENDMEITSASAKRPINDDSSEEELASPLPAKKTATSSSASEQSGTRVPKGRGGGDLPKILLD